MKNEEHNEFFEMLSSGNYDQIVANNYEKDFFSFQELPDEGFILSPLVAHEILGEIRQSKKAVVKNIHQKSKRISMFRWIAAASVFIIASGAYYFYEASNASLEAKFASLIPKQDYVYENKENQDKVIALEDGSLVTLKSNSKLFYPSSFKTDKREVYLEGAAFFEIAKDSRKPFYVYYKQLVTKVLGTSFYMGANDSARQLFVKVRTGRVEVSENDRLIKSNENRTAPVVVSPNQQARYQQSNRHLDAEIVDNPMPLIKLKEGLVIHPIDKKDVNPAFVYDQASLSKVFKDIQDAYGVEIILSNPDINNCTYTGYLGDQDLFTKFSIICLSTKSNYEIIGTKILINGKGCKVP
ncbi:FecR family protein [Parasediminibacterium sp. JCM 36343]|uniref:FecR family protein n=1 Tax=Parasediminibacterium sp. JCM 36343 TaxID=3374279 RepID=UPI00397AE798